MNMYKCIMIVCLLYEIEVTNAWMRETTHLHLPPPRPSLDSIVQLKLNTIVEGLRQATESFTYTGEITPEFNKLIDPDGKHSLQDKQAIACRKDDTNKILTIDFESKLEIAYEIMQVNQIMGVMRKMVLDVYISGQNILWNITKGKKGLVP